MTAVTGTPQQLRAAALLAILDTPGLEDTCWTIDATTEAYEWAGLAGQFVGILPIDRARAIVCAYAFELGIQMQPEMDTLNFRRICAKGEYMGVVVKVWAAAKKPGASA